MSYTIKKYKDIFTLTNTDVLVLTHTLEKLNNCYNYTEVIPIATLNANGIYNFTSLTDGEYQIQIVQDSIESTITLKSYINLQRSMIEDIELILCGCDCSNCDDCDATCNDKLTTILKLMTYIVLTYPQYNVSLEKISGYIKCLLSIDISCLLVNEKITGLSDNSKVLKQIIASYYLSLYFLEKLGASDSDDGSELTYIDNKFKFNKISSCISKLGINISEIEEKITNDMGTFTINSGAYINLPPSAVGDITIGVLNRAVTVLTLAMFTTSTVPAYSDPEGDAADAVRIDTLPVDGVLYLSGVPVTAGQIISVANINSNLLTYESPDQDAIDNDTFTFSIRDTGSLTFAS